MRLAELIEGIDGVVGVVGGDTPIDDLAEDSRFVGPGALFIARAGSATHGGRFIPDALARGASAVLTDAATAVPAGVPVARVGDVAGAAARIAERFFGEPSRSVAVAAVTGTNGKTTTAHLIQQIVRLTGGRCGLLGTVHVDDGAERTPARLTTPGAVEISRTLARMAANGCGACAMEASSHAIDQRRLDAVRVRVAVFTNLTGDHLDYHGSMEAYAAAKAKLFESLGDDAVAVVNADDAHARRMTRGTRAEVLRCSVRDTGADVFVRASAATARGSDVRVRGPWGEVGGRYGLLGEYNLMNLAEALAGAHAAGSDVMSMDGRLDGLGAPPGRLEPVRTAAPGAEPTVLVDYAHTDDALASALSAVRPIVPAGGRLWVVFGCGGDRDATKRPRMGAAAALGADRVVVTSDNPRTEDPETIIEMILRGVAARAGAEVAAIPDRREAITHAVERADARDVVLIAGKGHEDYQIVPDGSGGTIRRDFDDRLVARAALERRLGTMAAAS